MRVFKFNMAAIAVYKTKFGCMVTPKFYDSNARVFMFKMLVFKIFQKINYISILKFMSFEGYVKGHVFQKQAWRPPMFMFYLVKCISLKVFKKKGPQPQFVDI